MPSTSAVRAGETTSEEKAGPASAAPGHSGDTPPAAGDRPEDGKYELMQRLAHELRGPAGVSTHALRELELALASGAPTEPLFGMLRRCVKRFTRLADRLSMASELGRGAAHLELAPVDVRELVRAASTDATELLGRRGIEVTVELDDTPATAHADARWLGAAIRELCTNAVQFARKSVVVRVRQENGVVQIVVQDDGPGFGGGSPLDRTAKRAYATGLGLSLGMARDIVAAHDGQLVFSQTEPAGGTVIVALPPASGRPASQDAAGR